jgi:3-methyladenine DNA glycosylase AlkD
MASRPRPPPAERPRLSLAQALARLQAQARPEALAGMARFGMATAGRLGLSVPALRQLGREIGRDHALAQQLAATGVPDAQILAAYLAEPAAFTVAEMDTWVAHLGAWDSCDQACTNAFAPSPRAWGRVPVWAARSAEFERRAGFALLAALAVHDRAAEDARFIEALAWVEAAADDERNFVKKAVNWALRQVGKRNAVLRVAAIACALRLRQRPGRAARWIANDALRELQRRGPALPAPSSGESPLKS